MINVNSLFWTWLPVLLVTGVFYFLARELKLKRRRERAPFKKDAKLLHPPGESLRLKLEKLDELIINRLLLVVVVAAITSSYCQQFAGLPVKSLLYLAFSLGVAVSLGLLLWAWKPMKKAQNFRLGFDGERIVGEELNQLMLKGCHVFHDVPVGKLGNIDHVVVAPHAVFAIETKTRRKRNRDKNKAAHEVTYDGRKLEFPSGRDTDALQQAARNAKWLADHLTRLTSEKVHVKPVLTFPGWFVDRQGKGIVNVVNPRELPDAIVDERSPRMNANQHERIVRLLEERCRNGKLHF